MYKKIICVIISSCFINLYLFGISQKEIKKNELKNISSQTFSEKSISIKHIRFGSNSDPLQGLTISWESNGINDYIQWGYTNLFEQGTFSVTRRTVLDINVFDYTFPSLSGNQTIFYKLFDSQANEWSEEMTFYTAVEKNSSKFSFLAMGDSRTNVSDWRSVSNAANVNKTDFTIFTGDIVGDGSSVSDWNNWFDYGKDFLGNNLVYHSIGNHECYGNGEAIYPNIFTLPKNTQNTEYYYSFTFGNALFICLDTEEDQTGTYSSVQYNWLLNVLQENKNKTWKIIWFHRPFYTTGSHEGEMNYKMETWFNAFDTYGVDMIFSGHDHMYERTKPVQKNELVVDEYGSNSDQGRCQVVCGGAGAPLYSPGSAPWLEASAKKFHYCKIEIDGYNLNFEAFDENNVKFDDLSIEKDGSVSVEEFNLNTNVTVYPNPTNNQITILGNDLEISEWRIFNIAGQELSLLVSDVKKHENSIVIDISGLPAGMYLIRIKNTVHKVIKE